MKNWKRILLASDLSPFGDDAARIVKSLVTKGVKVLLLHVLEPVDIIAAGDGAVIRYYNTEHTRRRLEMATQDLEALAAQIGKEHCSSLVVRGTVPDRVISKEAAKWKADLICISTHGRSAWSRLFIGSVAQKLLSHYQGAVLLLKPSSGRLK